MEQEESPIKSDESMIPSLPTDETQKARFDEYATPEFTQRLLDHINRAVKAALRDAEG